MPIHPAFRRGRQVLLFVAAVLVFINALGVLVYVQPPPAIGLRCAFRTTIIGINEEYVRADPGEPGQQLPRSMDVIVQVGRHRTPTWIHLLRALEENRRSDLEPPVQGQPPVWQKRAGEIELLVRFHKKDQPEKEYECWCRFDEPHPRELVPSAIWLVL